MTYSKRGPRARARRRLPFALILAPFVITAGGRLVYSSVPPVPPRRVLPHHVAARRTPPRFLPTSCAPQLVPSDGNGSAEKTLDLRAAHGGTGHRICGMFSGERY